MGKKDFEGAKSDYAKVIEIKPNDGLAYYPRGFVEIKMKLKVDACNDFNKAKELGFAKADEMITKYCKEPQKQSVFSPNFSLVGALPKYLLFVILKILKQKRYHICRYKADICVNSLIVSLFFLFAFAVLPAKAQFPDYLKYFEKNNVEGCFSLYNMNENSFVQINESACKHRHTPASTFKILNSLIALETGVANDTDLILKWDGVERNFPNWNKDQNMKSAFKNSTVWYYQELARRIGEKNMKKFVELCRYGNMDISGGIDKFWLNGGLLISPDEQLDFLFKLYNYNLPFAKKSIDAIKDILLSENNIDYKLFAKTGWGMQDSLNIGWYIGWVETGKNVYFFSTEIESKTPDNSAFPIARIEITKAILRDLKILP